MTSDFVEKLHVCTVTFGDVTLPRMTSDFVEKLHVCAVTFGDVT